jgi:hypothetical protein
VSTTLDRVDWNAEFVRRDLGTAVQQLKRESGNGLFVGGVKLPLALAELGLIDEYEFVVHPRLAGHGSTLFTGLSNRIDLRLVSRLEFGSGAVAMRYEPKGSLGHAAKIRLQILETESCDRRRVRTPTDSKVQLFTNLGTCTPKRRNYSKFGKKSCFSSFDRIFLVMIQRDLPLSRYFWLFSDLRG